MRSIRIEPAEGAYIPPRTLRNMHELKNILLQHIKAPIMPEYSEVSLEDYLTAAAALVMFTLGDSVNDSISKNALSGLEEFVEYYENNGDVEDIITRIIFVIGIRMSRINGSMYYLVKEPVNLWTDDFRTMFCFRVNRVKAQRMHITIDNRPRPAYRVGLPVAEKGMKWLKLSPARLGIRCSFSDLPLDVYIQSHAIMRLSQRLDIIMHTEQLLSLYFALKSETVIPLWKNRALVEFRIKSEKMGYYIVELVQGVIVVRTFLFITNSGCPEGDRLDRELAIGKLEKEYTGLDKLSTFVYSDLRDDTSIRKIFDNVGIGYLFDLEPEMFGSEKQKLSGFAADFRNYILLEPVKHGDV